jgi:hypothetical protein
MRAADDIGAIRDALARLEQEGSDMSSPMTLDFFVAVPNREVGEVVSARVKALGFRTSVERGSESGDWTCYCTKVLIPTLAIVIATENELDRLAEDVGGYVDGFGSLGNA